MPVTHSPDMSFLNPVNKSFCLEQVCESNYQKLFKLIPDLVDFRKTAIGLSACHSALHLKVLNRTAHTLTIEMSYCFDKEHREFFAPAINIRVYLDAQLAEVINDHVRENVYQVFKDPGLSLEIMNYKWRLNYFLQKWLDHCLTKAYRFTMQNEDVAVG